MLTLPDTVLTTVTYPVLGVPVAFLMNAPEVAARVERCFGYWRDLDPEDAQAEPGGRGTAEIAVTDLAALYTGFQIPSFLASAGRLDGADQGAIAWLGRAFRASEPTMVDFF